MATYGKGSEARMGMRIERVPVVRQLAKEVMEQALAVQAGKTSVMETVTVLGRIALGCLATGTMVNTAAGYASEALVAAGRRDAAENAILIARGVVSYLLLASIIPELKEDRALTPRASAAAPRQFVPSQFYRVLELRAG